MTVYEMIQKLSKYKADTEIGVLVTADKYLDANVVCDVLNVDEYVSRNGKELVRVNIEL